MGQHGLPCVPGHEIVGRVTEVGAEVTLFKTGELAGCRLHGRFLPHLPCLQGGPGAILRDRASRQPTTAPTSDRRPDVRRLFQRDRRRRGFVLRIPANLELAARGAAACAGITTYSPLRHWRVGPGQKVGIVGLGGLGHMGVKIAARHGRACRAVHHVAGQSRGRQATRRRRSRDLKKSGRDGGAREQLRLHSQHRRGAARSRAVHPTC